MITFKDLCVGFLITCLYATTISDGARVKRSDSMRVVSSPGEPFPCNGAKSLQYQAQGIRRVELDDEQKLALLRALGGEFLPSFMGWVHPEAFNEKRTRGTIGSPWQHVIKRKGRLETKDQNSEREKSSRTYSSIRDTYEYCNNRTEELYNSPQYLRMCTSCAKTTYMSADYWPTEFYETECLLGHLDCLFSNGTPNGRCHTTTMWATRLRKDGGTCVTMTADGETVISELWMRDDVEISIGCECAIDKNSNFR